MSRSLSWESRSWLARVRTGDQANAPIAGAAFAIDRRHLLTCAHVIHDVGARGPGARVFVDFPLLGGQGSWALLLEDGWRPAPKDIDPQSVGDVAILELESELPGIEPLPLRRRWTYNRLGFSCYGFPRAHPESDIAHGRLGFKVGSEWLRIEADATAPVEPGFSGAPVWADDVNGVVAMILTRKTGDGRVAFAIPLEIVARTSTIVHSALELADPLAWLSGVPPSLATDVIPFGPLIRERTDDFVGRGFVFSAIHQRMDSKDFEAGYILIRGKPGIGKSAIMAQIARTQGHVHHFNIATEDVRSPAQFLRNACAQLIVRYNLPVDDLAGRAVNSQLLKVLLEDAVSAAANKREKRVVLLVDALDESESPPENGNRLSLPQTLPKGVYIVATIRNGVDERLFTTQRSEDIVIQENGEENKADILQYIHDYIARYPDEMRTRIEEWETTPETFGEILWVLSEGNFMYLHHVLPDIRRTRITRNETKDLSRLPRGLESYYQRHWSQMKDRDKKRYRRLQEPVLCLLAKARDPVPSEYVAQWINESGMFDPVAVEEVDDVFDEWSEFLEKTTDIPPRYRLYHNTFLEFLSKEVGLERFGRAKADAMRKKVNWDDM